MNEVPQPQPKKKKSPWIWVAIGCGGFALIAACAITIPVVIGYLTFQDRATDAAEAQRTLQQQQTIPAPSGTQQPECATLSRCCSEAQAIDSSVGLFCQLTGSTGEACGQQLTRVRTYLAERSQITHQPIPASCQ